MTRDDMATDGSYDRDDDGNGHRDDVQTIIDIIDGKVPATWTRAEVIGPEAEDEAAGLRDELFEARGLIRRAKSILLCHYHHPEYDSRGALMKRPCPACDLIADIDAFDC